jgi:hypothetical protein
MSEADRIAARIRELGGVVRRSSFDLADSEKDSGGGGSAAPEPAAPLRELPHQAVAVGPQREAGAEVPADAGSAAGGESVVQVLAAGGAPGQLAAAALGALGETAARTLRDDPWAILAVPGVLPEQADAFARALLGSGAGPEDVRRGRALVLWLLGSAARQGHTAVELARLRGHLSRYRVPEAAADAAIREVAESGAVLMFQEAAETSGAAGGAAADAEEVPVRVLLALDHYALAEESLAESLLELAGTVPGFGPEGAADSAAWELAAESAASEVSASAGELIRAAAGSGLVLHTGGEAARAEPVALVEAARRMGLRARLSACTPDSRRRLAALLPDAPEAAVLLDELPVGSVVAKRPEDGALELDLLVVCDAPMLDTEAATRIAELLPDGARLVLSGDPALLWSVGPGRVFGDLLGSRQFPEVASRTPDPGPVGELLSGIGFGELLEVEAPGKEVVVVPVRSAEEAVHRAGQLVAESVPRAFGIGTVGVQVIAPLPGGPAGAGELNKALKAGLNPGPGRFGGFDPGDRVVFAAAPGRHLHGTVVSGDAAGLRLDCAGEALTVGRESAGRLTHGWAVTVRQAAGHRWPAVVLVLPGDAAKALNRQLVYTAVAAAERHLSMVQGLGPELAATVAGSPAAERTTRLRPILVENRRSLAEDVGGSDDGSDDGSEEEDGEG